MRTLFQDVRFALRILGKNPGFTLTVLAVLALGIGAISAMFSVAGAVLLHPLPYPDPDRLVILLDTNLQQGVTGTSPSTANALDWQEQTRTLTQFTYWRFVYFNLSDDRAEPERLRGFRVTSDFFPLLRVTPMLGRSFLPEEYEPGRDRAVLLTYGLWERRFGADPRIVGETVRIDGQPTTVVGVLPREYQMFRVLNHDIELYMPLVLDRGRTSRDDHAINIWARLAPGRRLEEARAEMTTIARRLEREYPKTNKGWSVRVMTQPEAFVKRFRTTLLLLLGAVGFVLLIACANIANLLLARAASRRKELAIRSAVGGGRARLIRQLITESLVLAALGGALGILVSRWTTQLLNNLITHIQLLRMRPFAVDGSALAFTTAVTLATGVLFGLWPAFLATRAEVSELLRGAAPRQRRAASRPLVVAEVALAVILLTGAGLTLRSSLRLAAVDRGLELRGLLTMQIGLPDAEYQEPAQIVDFFDRVLERAQALPGVVSASAVNYPPTGLLGTGVNFAIEGRPPAAPDENLFTSYWVVDPAYFRTMAIPLLTGRVFTGADADLDTGSVIVNENMAQRFWPGAGRGDAALGRRIRLEFPQSDAFWLPRAGEHPLTIVGVVGNVREDEQDAAMPQVYLPYRQNPLKIMHLLVRSAGGDPVSLAHAVQREVTVVDPNQPVSEIRTMEQVAAETFSQRRVFGALLGVFAVLALVLATLGIYGLVTYSVAERTPEIGVRIALGAQRRDIFVLVLGQAMQLVLTGVALGLAGAYLLGRVLTGLVFGIEPSDPTVFVSVSLALILVALLAGLLPVRRATRIDPVEALRQD